MLKTNARSLALALSRALPLVRAKNTIPILGSVRLRTEAGKVTVSSTDLDMTLDVEATIEPGGPSAEVCINPRPLLAILKMLPREDAIELALDGAVTVIANWNGGRARLLGMSAGDFPDMKTFGTLCEGTFDATAREALERVAPCVSSEETRYYLNGVCLDEADGLAVFAATDGHRLSVMPAGASVTAAFKSLPQGRPIIPRAAVHHLLALSAKSELGWRMSGDVLGARHIEAWADGVRFRSKLIDGTFPPWWKVLPKREHATPIVLSRANVMRACSLLGFSSKSNRESVLVISKGRAQLVFKSHDLGDVALDLGAADGERTIGVNSKYLADAMRIVRGKSVTLWPGGDMGPIAIEGSDCQPGEHVIVMPHRWAEPAPIVAPAYEEAA